MSIKTEVIVGTEISNKVNSSNIVESRYDIEKKIMQVEFKNGSIYEYYDIPHAIYTRFRLSESQGKFLHSTIAKSFKYKKKYE